jgi:xanthosine utilization system XapX-like protein
LGIAALVLGIIAFVISFIPIVNFGSFIMGGLAVILGVVALVTHKPKGPPLTGAILGLVGIIITAAMIASVNKAVDAALQTGGAAATQTATTAATDGTTAPAAEATSATSSAASAYAVTIDGSHKTQDYEGKPVVVVNYTFTNNSDKDVSFMLAVSAKAFQNGVELEHAIITGDADYDGEGAMKDLKPGASLTVQEGYVLNDTSDVTVEVGELFNFKDTLIASQVISVA